MNKQVESYHYQLSSYVTFERWQSYLNQVKETLRFNPKTVLVIGPGDLIVVSILRGYGIEVKTVDIDADQHPDYTFSVDEINVPQKFDVVLCSQVLEHLPFEKFEKSLERLKSVTGNVLIVSLPEKSLRFSLILKFPRLKPLFMNFVIPFFFMKHKFNGEHYWELNSCGFSTKKIRSVLNKYFVEESYYRLKTNPYHFFFILKVKA